MTAPGSEEHLPATGSVEVVPPREAALLVDTAALKRMRQQIADGTDPRTVAEAWLAENPLGR